MDFQAIRERAVAIGAQYAHLERMKYGREWTGEELALGLVGDVGDLAKLVAAKEGVRQTPNVHANLAHELVDCLWSVLVLAERYGVDLEREFVGVMDELEASIGQSLSPPG